MNQGKSGCAVQSIVRTPDAGLSHWMPDPSGGYTNVGICPANSGVTGFTSGFQVMVPGETLPEHHHAHNEELFYICRGQGVARIGGEEHSLQPGTTVFCGRNVSHTFVNTGDEPLEWFFLFLPGGLEIVLGAVGAPRSENNPRPATVPRPSTMPAQARFLSTPGLPGDDVDIRTGIDRAGLTHSVVARRPGPAIVLAPDDGLSHWMPDPSRGWTTVKICPLNSPVTGFSMGIQRLEPEEVLPEHHHKHFEELFFIVRGNGVARIDGAPFPLAPRTTVYCKSNATHTFVNGADEPMEFVWVFFPAGLEHMLASVGTAKRPGETRPSVVRRPETLSEMARYISTRGRPQGHTD